MDSRHAERAAAFFAAWVIIALYVDGWGHVHNRPDTFFSVWHAGLYSGIATGVSYFVVRSSLGRRRVGVPDALTRIGLGIFVVGGIGDIFWHEIFGIEVDLEAVLSPTHIVLMTGGLLMFSFPARSAARREGENEPGWISFLPTATSLIAVAALATFYTHYLSMFQFAGLHIAPGGIGQLLQIRALASVFVTTLILFGATLFAVRRWRTPLGTFAALYGLIAVGMTGIYSFSFPLHIPAAALAGAVADVMVARLRPSADRRPSALAFAAIVPAVLTSCWLVALLLMDGVEWPPSLWAGTVPLSMIEGLGLGLLVFPARHSGAVGESDGVGPGGAQAARPLQVPARLGARGRRR